MVLYFTGTGNSRYLARRIAEGLEMPLYDLNAVSRQGILPRCRPARRRHRCCASSKSWASLRPS